ncbi:hypothetical protein OG21DRAFT_1528329, partial [Imleria badia]
QGEYAGCSTIWYANPLRYHTITYVEYPGAFIAPAYGELLVQLIRPTAQALAHRMRTERSRSFSHVATITVRLILHRPTRLAILLSILGLLTLGVTFSVNYIRSNFVGTFGPGIVYTQVNASTSPEGVVLLATVWSLDPDYGTMSVRPLSLSKSRCFQVHSGQASWSVMGGCGVNYTFERNTFILLPWEAVRIANGFAAGELPTHTPRSIPTTSFETVLQINPFIPYTLDKTTTTLYYPFDAYVLFHALSLTIC